MPRPIAPLLLASAALVASAPAAPNPSLAFKKLTLTTEFHAEGAGTGDFNRDGHGDVAAGPFWFAGPDFTQRHEIYAPVELDRLKYSKNFFSFGYDFNGDGWTDVLVIGFPGEDASWFENPKGAAGHWQRHVVFPTVGNESPDFADINGDGRPELVCVSDGRFGWAGPADWKQSEKPWVFHPITAPGKLGPFTHGLGLGDVNGDGRLDLLERTGWSEQPASLTGDPVWVKHDVPFAPGRGGAQMFAADVNGDGRADVISGQSAHGYGLSWFEQLPDGGWREQVILSTDAGQKSSGVQFSELHAITFADLDGNGLKDIITGKRWWSHGPDGEPGAKDPAVLYVFLQTRAADGSVAFTPHLIDSESGVGTQLTIADLNQDRCPDIVVGNKRGIFVFLSQPVAR